MSSIPKASIYIYIYLLAGGGYLSPYRKKKKIVSSKYLPCLIVYGYTNNTRGTSIHHDSLPTIITKQTDKRTSSSFFAFSPVRARELSNNVVAWQWRTFVEWPPREREKDVYILYIIYIYLQTNCCDVQRRVSTRFNLLPLRRMPWKRKERKKRERR